MDPAIIGGGLNLLGSLFGKKKTMTPARSILSTARGVRMAAKETGLNALTLLGASNATAGAGMDMGTSPLASLSVLGSFIQDEFSDEAKQRKEHNRLQNELLTLEVERARTLSAVAPVASVAGGGALTGGRGNARVGSLRAGGVFGSPGYIDNSWMTPGREDKVKAQEHGSAVLHYDNAVTGPITLFGDDGEPWLEYLQVPLFGGLQVANNWARKVAKDYVVPGLESLGFKANRERMDAPYGRDSFGRALPKPTF